MLDCQSIGQTWNNLILCLAFFFLLSFTFFRIPFHRVKPNWNELNIVLTRQVKIWCALSVLETTYWQVMSVTKCALFDMIQYHPIWSHSERIIHKFTVHWSISPDVQMTTLGYIYSHSHLSNETIMHKCTHHHQMLLLA